MSASLRLYLWWNRRDQSRLRSSCARESLRFFLRILEPKTYRRREHVSVYFFESLEPDAIAGHACLAEVFSVCLGQVFLVLDTEDVDRDPGIVGAQTDPVKLSGRSVGIFDDPGSVSDIRI